TSGLRGDSEITQFACRHGDGGRNIALQVPSAADAYRGAVQRGARGVAEPQRLTDEYGSLELAVIATYGEVVHTFVNRHDYAGPFAPGFVSTSIDGRGDGVGLEAFDHVVGTVEAMKERGMPFLDTPDAYYDEVESRVGEISEDYDDLKRLRILADRDEDGYLLQIFTKTAQDRPTVFFEVIERHGATTFGEGNFKALFESIEREQALRGNL